MSVERAARGSLGDREILAAALVDLLERAVLSGQFPCAVVVCCALAVLSAPPFVGMGRIYFSMDGIPLGKHRLLRHHPAVVRACMKFLSTASTALLAVSMGSLCTCQLPDNSILHQFHRSGNVYARVPAPVVLAKSNGVLDAILVAIEPCTRQLRDEGLAHRFHYADYMKLSGVDGPWPEGRTEAVDSIDMATLGPNYPSDALLVILLNLLDLLPFPLRVERAISAVIPQVVVPFLAKLGQKWRQSARGSQRAREYVNMLNHCCHLFESACLGGDHMLLVALRQHQVIYSKLMGELEFPFDVEEIEALDVSCYRQYRMFVLFVARVHDTLDLEYNAKRFGVKEEMLKEILTNYCRPVERQMTAVEELLRSNRSCARRGCTRDYMTVRHGLDACAGCSCVFYCSRSCQKKAWRDAESPHKEVCKIMKEIVSEGLAVPEHWKVSTRYKRLKEWDDALTFYEGFCTGEEKIKKIEEVLMHIYKCYAQVDS